MNHYEGGVEVPPCSINDLRRIAKQIRNVMALSDDKPFPVAQFIEYVLPCIYSDFVLEIVPKEDFGDKHGETIPDQHVI